MTYQETKKIKYYSGLKYQLFGDCWLKTDILGFDFSFEEIRLYPDGWLLLQDGFAWDGPSGPALDTKSFMRGSAGHDAVCILIAEGLLPPEYKKNGNRLMRRLCKDDGMFFLRRYWTYSFVEIYSLKERNPYVKRKLQTAP
jgi:hypothetical protein